MTLSTTLRNLFFQMTDQINAKQLPGQLDSVIEPSFAGFHQSVQRWFTADLGEPTSCQLQAWSKIQSNHNVLITAPTGSGKTLAAFLSCINKLVEDSIQFGGLCEQTQILYISPLRALSNDIEKNLQMPLAGIDQQLMNQGLAGHGIRTAVRTGDTSAWERQKINRKPPDILVSTPESLYIMLTSIAGRKVLSTVNTVIVDEIHALIDSKRGAHLALSLERLRALVGHDYQRIGLSATIKDKQWVSGFLSSQQPCHIVDAGSQRQRDLQLCLPCSALTAVMSGEVWNEIYDQLVDFTANHRTTLVFVNTRRLAERLARQLAERLDENCVSTHHGSLSRAHRLDAENRLKNGQLKVLVATASLELGIDIGDVDLVCQIGSPKSISTFIQRVGRSGHGISRVPKGRLFPTTLEELVESVALLDAVDKNQLDTLLKINSPLDVLAQQIIAEVSARDWPIEELFDSFKRAQSFKDLSREQFDKVILMLVQGFTNRRGRRFAYLHIDAVNGIVKARQAARLTALTNGGAIPELFDYDVFLIPDNFRIGSVNEDFAFESMAGDIFQLGNTSYRILKVETGKVYVEDAKGLPPSIPFWFGEAPGRSLELSQAVSELMGFCESLFRNNATDVSAKIKAHYKLDDHGALQLYDYLHSAYSALGELPKFESVIFERFFDENDDMHLVIHSVYGSAINRAWGLALRKRFCRKFNFELQAAALENSIILSLGATHSFPLEEVSTYLSFKTVKDVVIQAMLDAPIFNTHWRWVCNIALAVKRFNGGKRLAPQIQRNNAEDLAAQVFPDQLACLENIAGAREIPDHPLVQQAIDDCIYEVMDVAGLEKILAAIKQDQVNLIFKDLPQPSVLSQAIINARPYAFLDDAAAEERRTQALQSAVYGSSHDMAHYGLIPDFAIERLNDEIVPLIRNAEEAHDALCIYGLLDSHLLNGDSKSNILNDLAQQGRIQALTFNNEVAFYYAPEWQQLIELVYPQSQANKTVIACKDFIKQVSTHTQAVVELVRGQLELLGPIKQVDLQQRLQLAPECLELALLELEQEGFVMQGEYVIAGVIHWCERRLLARLHRYALQQARESIRPVEKQQFVRFVYNWQQLTPQTKGRGINALMGVVEKLQGYALPLTKWRDLLAARVEGFNLSELETLFLAGQLIWYRPRSGIKTNARVAGLKRNSLISIYTRQAARTLDINQCANVPLTLSSTAQCIDEVLGENGALFFDEIQEKTRLLTSQLESGLSELVAAGLITCDSFQALLKLVNSRTQKRKMARRIGRNQPFAGRWSRVIRTDGQDPSQHFSDDYLMMACEILLKRYGVIYYSLLQRETGFPPWRQLRYMLKRMEARGELLGGRFVSGVSGEQYAYKEALALLRSTRADKAFSFSERDAVDPINLSQSMNLGEHIPITSKGRFVFREGKFSLVEVRH